MIFCEALTECVSESNRKMPSMSLVHACMKMSEKKVSKVNHLIGINVKLISCHETFI